MEISPKILLEICLDSVESAIAAQEGGAHRIELCENLAEGGTTPGVAMIEYVRKSISIGLHIMIRPRPCDFCYSSPEFELMKNDIAIAKRCGADGIVFGILNADGTVDTERTRMLVDLAKPMSVTFHRAFDVAREPFKALEDIIECGVNRLLTSGQQASAIEGIGVIGKLVKQAGNHLIIMPGAGIHEGNVNTILARSGAKEIHIGTGATRNSVVDKENIRKILTQIAGANSEQITS